MTQSLFDIPLTRLDGTAATLADYAGKVLLIVNVASKCGLTPQYEGLEALYRRYGPEGLVVLGFPANDFMGQEPGSDAEIGAFCRSVYGVEFPMFSKIAVTGEGRHPLYAALTAAQPAASFLPGSPFLTRPRDAAKPADEINWNFEKFLVGRDGQVLARFAPDTQPEDASIVAAIQAALAG